MTVRKERAIMRIMIVTEEFLPASDGLVLRLTEAIRYFLKEGHRSS